LWPQDLCGDGLIRTGRRLRPVATSRISQSVISSDLSNFLGSPKSKKPIRFWNRLSFGPITLSPPRFIPSEKQQAHRFHYLLDLNGKDVNKKFRIVAAYARRASASQGLRPPSPKRLQRGRDCKNDQKSFNQNRDSCRQIICLEVPNWHLKIIFRWSQFATG
jgi:hypothetical protein